MIPFILTFIFFFLKLLFKKFLISSLQCYLFVVFSLFPPSPYLFLSTNFIFYGMCHYKSKHNSEIFFFGLHPMRLFFFRCASFDSNLNSIGKKLTAENTHFRLMLGFLTSHHGIQKEKTRTNEKIFIIELKIFQSLFLIRGIIC